MGTHTPPAEGESRRIDDLVQRIELELRQAIDYVNDAVVPQVRQESISAMRTVADKLRGLADRMDTHAPSTQEPPLKNQPGGPLA